MRRADISGASVSGMWGGGGAMALVGGRDLGARLAAAIAPLARRTIGQLIVEPRRKQQVLARVFVRRGRSVAADARRFEAVSFGGELRRWHCGP